LCAANKQPKLIEMPVVDVSSTDIRRRAAAGESLDDLVPESVAQYIRNHDVYCQGGNVRRRQGEHHC
jgi:nicotinate-nucleotide adenylyltransferase